MEWYWADSATCGGWERKEWRKEKTIAKNKTLLQNFLLCCGAVVGPMGQISLPSHTPFTVASTGVTLPTLPRDAREDDDDGRKSGLV